MNPRTVFTKTEKGVDEIQQRQGGLAARERQLLIMIDGNRPLADLESRFGAVMDVPRTLVNLAEHGYIRLANGQPLKVPESLRAGTPERVSAGTAPGLSDPAVGLREQLIRLSKDMLGRDAERLVQKINSLSDDPEEVQAALGNCCRIIKLMIDEKKADAFCVAANQVMAAHLLATADPKSMAHA